MEVCPVLYFYSKVATQQFEGNLAAAINAVTLALVDAGIPMVDYVCACTAGFTAGTVMLGMLHANVLHSATNTCTQILTILKNLAKAPSCLLPPYQRANPSACFRLVILAENSLIAIRSLSVY